MEQSSKPIQDSSKSESGGAADTLSLAEFLRQGLRELDSLPPEERERIRKEERALARPPSDNRLTIVLRPKRTGSPSNPPQQKPGPNSH